MFPSSILLEKVKFCILIYKNIYFSFFTYINLNKIIIIVPDVIYFNDLLYLNVGYRY